MKFIVTDSLRDTMPRFGITENDIATVLESPAAEEVFSKQGWTLRALEGKHEEAGSVLVFGSDSADGTLQVDVALRVPKVVRSRFPAKTPLALLERLIGQFGLKVLVGKHSARYYRDQRFTFPKGAELGTFIRVDNPEEHSLLLSSYVKVVDEKSRNVVYCLNVFCLDTTRYEEWLTRQSASQAG